MFLQEWMKNWKEVMVQLPQERQQELEDWAQQADTMPLSAQPLRQSSGSEPRE